MRPAQIWARMRGRYQRTASSLFYRRPLKMHNEAPYISFTFDDFPRSALHNGGAILEQVGLRATYYASLGLMGTTGPTGRLCAPEDIKELFARGHELGCHTFAHCHSWETHPEIFEDSILRNRRALGDLGTGATFRSFSYPIIGPCPDSKRRASSYFESCRCGGQTFNNGATDLNLLKAYFLEKNRDAPEAVKAVIDRNRLACGWLIFATHDIDETPTPYGCTPAFFKAIVEHALLSGARILPVTDALDEIVARAGD